MNVELLLKVKKHILQKPTRLRMSTWLVNKESNGVVLKGKSLFLDISASCELNDTYGEPLVQKLDDCGTIGCIAGWTCMLSGITGSDSLNYKACVLLQLNLDQESRLFYVGYWPTSFKDRYLVAKNQKERAKIVGERIDFFIKTDGTHIKIV